MLRHRLLALRARLAAACARARDPFARDGIVVAGMSAGGGGAPPPSTLPLLLSATTATNALLPTITLAPAQRWMATEATKAAAAAAPPSSPQQQRHRQQPRAPPTAARRPRLNHHHHHHHHHHGFLDTRPTPWVAAFSEAQAIQELSRLIDQWTASSSSSASSPPPTLREATAAVTRLSALGAAAARSTPTTTSAPREAILSCLDRINRAIEASAFDAASAAVNTGPAASARGPVGPALSAAHLLVQHARMRAPPYASGLGSSLVTLATSGAGGRASTNPAVMALWASIRLAEVEAGMAAAAASAAATKRKNPNKSADSSSLTWQDLARQARRDLSALVLRHHAGKEDFGAPSAGGKGGGANSPTAPPVVHSNHFNLAIWSIASVGPPYSPEELRALEILLQGTARFYSSPPPTPTTPTSDDNSKRNNNTAAHHLPDLATLFVGLGRLNADVLPAMSARGVSGGRESFGRKGKKKKKRGAADEAADEADDADATSPSSSAVDWRSLGNEALMYELAAATAFNDDKFDGHNTIDQGPFPQRKPGQAGGAATAASPELRRALMAAGAAAASAVPDALASGWHPNLPQQGQLLSCISWGLAMCAGVYDARAMNAIAAAVSRALAPGGAGASPSVVASYHSEHLARLPWAFARVGHYAPEMIDAVSRHAVPLMLAQARWAADAHAFATVASSAPPPPPHPASTRLFTVQNLANLAWGAAFLGYTRDLRLYQAALQCAGAPPTVFRTSGSARPPSPSPSSPSSALEADGKPLHLCLLLWAAASAAGGRAPDAFVEAATREVARYDPRQLPWTLAMQLLQAAAAGVSGSGVGGASGGDATLSPRFVLPPGALEALAASAEHNKVGSVVSDFHRGLAIMAEAAVQRRRKEWGEALGRAAGGDATATATPPPPAPLVPKPQLEARPPGALIGDVDVLVHWLPPPSTGIGSTEEQDRPKKRGRPKKKKSEGEEAAAEVPPPPQPPLTLPPQPVPIALEADGPSHFARSPSTHPLGRSLVRNRTLRALGLSVAVVPHWDWDRVHAEEKAAGEVARAAAAAAKGASSASASASTTKEWQRGERAAERMARLLDEAAANGEASGLM